MKPNKEKVGNRLKEVKNNSGFTLEVFAEKVGSTKTKMNSYMRGVALAPIEVLENISQLFRISLDWIYFGDLDELIGEYLISKEIGDIEDYIPNFIDRIKDKINYQYAGEKVDEYVLKSVLYDTTLDFIELKVNQILKDIDSVFYPFRNSEDYSYEIEQTWQEFQRKLELDIYDELFETWYKDEESVIALVQEYTDSAEKWLEMKNPKYYLGDYQVNRDESNLVDFLINELGTDIGASTFLNNLSKLWTLDFDFEKENSKKIIEALKNLSNELENIKIHIDDEE